MADREKLPALTGLRGIAALLVVISHYAFWCAPYPRDAAPPLYTAIFNISGYGMTLFFTLSGFVIAYNYLDLPWRAAPLATLYRFLVLRVTRLYPVLLLFVAFIALNHPLGSRPVVVTAVHAASVQSWLPLVYDGALVTSSPFNVAWSISTEIMLYGLFAAAMILVGRFSGRTRHAAVACCFACALAVAALALISEHIGAGVAALPAALEPVSPVQARGWFFYLSPWFRIVDFTWGLLAALTVRHGLDRTSGPLLPPLAALAGVTIVALHVVVTAQREEFLSLDLQVATAPLFAVMMAAANADTRLNRVLASRPLGLIGTASYSLYLFHFLVPKAFGFEHFDHFSTQAVATTLIRMAGMILFSLVIAGTLYIVVEKPAKLWLRRLLLRRPAQPIADPPLGLASQRAGNR